MLLTTLVNEPKTWEQYYKENLQRDQSIRLKWLSIIIFLKWAKPGLLLFIFVLFT